MAQDLGPGTRAPWATGAPPAPGLPVPGGARTGLGLGAAITAAPWATKTSADALNISPDPAFPIVIEQHPETWTQASKRITSADDLKTFLQGESVREFLAFMLALNEGVKGKKLSDACEIRPPVAALLSALQQLSDLVDEIPPATHALRYGNPAYRTWFTRMMELAPSMLEPALPEASHPASVELASYWVDSFGNPTRIDYGTGHETTFLCLLFCLARLGVVGKPDAQALVTQVLSRYLDLMRKVQTTYWLEPAGSHGVWGLDDYQFMPFVLGSGQLVAHPMIKPKSIHNPDILEMYSHEYMYLAAVRFVKQVKKGPLQETSPIINDISSVPTWAKVNSGMVKMYQAEVLSKFPIMQHFLFGVLLPFK